MFNIMICNITKMRIRLSICTSSEVVLSSICSLNARSIIKKKTELNIMVDDIKPHIIGIITESWANNDITNAELGLEGYVMFRKDRIGRRGGGVLLYIKDTIPAYEVQLYEEAYCNEAIWCNLVSYRTYNSYHWSSISLSQHNQTEQRNNSQCYK